MSKLFLFLATGLFFLSVSTVFSQKPCVPACGTQNTVYLDSRPVSVGSVINFGVKFEISYPIRGLDFQMYFNKKMLQVRSGFSLQSWPFYCTKWPMYSDFWQDGYYHLALAATDSICGTISGSFRLKIDDAAIPGTYFYPYHETRYNDTTYIFGWYGGSILVWPRVIYGDANLDSAITVMDAVKALDIASLGGRVKDTTVMLSADVDGGYPWGVDTYDAWLILRRVVDPSTCFPVQDFCSSITIPGFGKSQTVGVVPRANSVDLYFMEDVHNGEVEVKIPIGAKVEFGSALSGSMYRVNTTSDGLILRFIKSDPLPVNKPFMKIIGANSKNIEIKGRVNNGLSIQAKILNPTDVDDPDNTFEIPKEFALQQNYPNPFNPTTTIRYELPEAGNVKIDIYNTLGQNVSTLVNKYKNIGQYKINFDATGLSSGIYFYILQTENKFLRQKMMLLK